MKPTTNEAAQSPGEAFAKYVIGRIKTDKGFGARLRRADSAATEYQAWEHLVNWCDLEKPWERLPFAVIAAALARAKPAKDGHLGIGQSIARCYEQKQKSDAAKAKLRRLLACHSTKEVCQIIRPLLRLIQSRGVAVKYGALLNEMLYFGERQRLRWAADFFGRRADLDRDDA